MPKSWYDRHTVNKIEDDNAKSFYRSIVADKKPYFMRYIYPALMKQYNTYIKNTNSNALRNFKMTVDEMKRLPYENLSDEQREFLWHYEQRMPVGTGDCIMNKICRRFEEEFDGYIGRYNSTNKFDYSILKSSSEYSRPQFYSIRHLYDDYSKRLQNYMIFASFERISKDETASDISSLNDEFKRDCNEVCPNAEELCNILLDICYAKKSTKKFVWTMCPQTIIQNLLEKNGNIISFPSLNQAGDIRYCGSSYSVHQKEIEVIR